MSPDAICALLKKAHEELMDYKHNSSSQPQFWKAVSRIETILSKLGHPIDEEPASHES